MTTKVIIYIFVAHSLVLSGNGPFTDYNRKKDNFQFKKMAISVYLDKMLI